MSVSSSPHPHRTICFAVTAAVDPSAMPRVLEAFALRSVVPERWHGTRIDAGTGNPADDTLAIEIDVAGLEERMTDVIGRKLQAMTCVRSALWTSKEATA